MDNLDIILNRTLSKDLLNATISGNKQQASESNNNVVNKIKIRPIIIKEEIQYQITEYIGKQVFHKNYDKPETIEYAKQNIINNFKQAQIETIKSNVSILVSKKGKLTIKEKMFSNNGIIDQGERLYHNKKKKYILDTDETIEFLVDLGVMSKDGKIINSKYDKYKQINRFLEFIRDIVPKLPNNREIHIIDFGCGKSYLTFAIYYYLHNILNLDVKITGLDLKQDVIENCNRLSKKYGFSKLEFLHGDIADYENKDEVDMVVTLHACDTATDYAIKKAVLWNAKIILSVPCCQHEVNKQIKSQLLSPILEYGILKDRLSAIITDGLRAKYLEEKGYETNILEFIDMEHTPKNLLIRAVKADHIIINKKLENNKEKVLNLLKELDINPTIYRD